MYDTYMIKSSVFQWHEAEDCIKVNFSDFNDFLQIKEIHYFKQCSRTHISCKNVFLLDQTKHICVSDYTEFQNRDGSQSSR